MAHRAIPMIAFYRASFTIIGLYNCLYHTRIVYAVKEGASSWGWGFGKLKQTSSMNSACGNCNY